MEKILIYLLATVGSGAFGVWINNFIPDVLSFLKYEPLNFAFLLCSRG